MRPGTVLGNRYTLSSRQARGDDLEHWSAHDSTLEREVAVTIIESRHPHASAALDAARRAAGVDDVRLLRILDVGRSDQVSWIVEEALTDAVPLASLLPQGRLPSEEARRITGEVASALETARHRGLHHLALNPHAVQLTPDGAVKVSGVAVAAALKGYDDMDSAEASRIDTVALVAIAYAALTTRWPLEPGIPDVEPAPRVVGGVPAPSEIARDVPGDLDGLCRLTLNDDAGPVTPGALAGQIAPWASTRVASPAGADQTLELPAVRDDAAAGTFASAAPHTADDTVPAARQPGAFSDDIMGAHDRLEPPLPMLRPETGEDPSRSQAGLVLGIVAVLVLVALGIGYLGLPNISLGSSSPAAVVPKRTVTVTASPSPSPSPSPTPSTSSPSPTPTPSGPITISSASALDPYGDNKENDDTVAQAIDGKTDTGWSSEGYDSAEFGGLKRGVGIVLDLTDPQAIHEVKLDLPSSGESLTLYAANRPSLTGATTIDTLDNVSGSVTAKAPKDLPKSRYVIVWFTKAAPDGGRYRAQLNEVTVS